MRGSLAVQLDSGAPLRYTPSPYPNWRGCCVLGCGQFIRANKRMRLYGKMKYLFQHSWHGSNFRARYGFSYLKSIKSNRFSAKIKFLT
ncbi:MAG: hypothetical protein ACK5X6_04865 [Chryseotalea sp.]